MTFLLPALTALPPRWEVAGTVAAPAGAVADLLLAIKPGRVGDDNLLVLAGMSAARRGAMTVAAGDRTGSYRAMVAGTGGQIDIEVDLNLQAVAVQSWYGGVHTITSAGDGASRVSHRVHTVLPGHQTPGDMESRLWSGLERVLCVVGDRLSRPTGDPVIVRATSG
ncbi:hypothetical protein [Nonomuraea typhae]|uniref:hypothetical protein n=1 Tax=Nonomuraea typhae TaxID=2603600 RepID=UPI0012FBA31A|nr:hypothetical protein [Nonomuraea typhae]